VELVLFLEVIGVGGLFTSIVRNRFAGNAIFAFHPAPQVHKLTSF
jgi:hypothetical protein